jgi:Xaa-Pro aminopeptidase
MAISKPEAVAARLAALRALMARQGLDLYLVPSADEHQNEYLPAYRRRREAVTGFTGSAGDAIIGASEAHLFVDSRYHLQADQEADPARFTVHKLGLAGVGDPFAWLTAREAGHGALRVGCDPFLLSLRTAQRFRAALRRAESQLVAVAGNLVDAVWADRPDAPGSGIYTLPDALTGEPVGDKLARVRAELERAQAGLLVLTRLDEVAWLTNLRGADIPCNPVFEAYLVLERERAQCFTDNPVPAAVRMALAGRVDFRPDGELAAGLGEALGRLAPGLRCWLDRDSSSEGVRLLAGEAPVLDDAPNPVARLKALKNAVEIERARQAHVRSGAAKVRSFSLLAQRLAGGDRVSEADYAALLRAEYAREEGFSDLSFDTIAAFGENGAIVHYGTPDPARWLQPGGMLLVDSGIQLLGATTDDTRTLAIGAPTPEQRRRYTDVLRAHVRLAMQVFPEGTTGQMLDAVARSPLWNQGSDYGHGTGHGVGAFLNVHEGPQSISQRGTVALEPGMIVSNEPGYYRAHWGGIRLENLYVVEEALGLPPHPGGKRWLRFSPLTLLPFDRALIEAERLAPEEQAWLADYHRRVWDLLSPELPEEPREWLRQACGPLPT